MVVSSPPVARMGWVGLKATVCTPPRCPTWLASSWPDATSHTLDVLSAPALATSFPSSLSATARTLPACLESITRCWPVVRSQIMTLPSMPPAAMTVPSALAATLLTSPIPASSRLGQLPRWSGRRARPSAPEPTASSPRSATEGHPAVGAGDGGDDGLRPTSQTVASPCSATPASRLPSALKATSWTEPRTSPSVTVEPVDRSHSRIVPSPVPTATDPGSVGSTATAVTSPSSVQVSRHLLLSDGVPHPHRVVVAAAGQQLPVRAERDAAHAVGVAAQRGQDAGPGERVVGRGDCLARFGTRVPTLGLGGHGQRNRRLRGREELRLADEAGRHGPVVVVVPPRAVRPAPTPRRRRRRRPSSPRLPAWPDGARSSVGRSRPARWPTDRGRTAVVRAAAPADGRCGGPHRPGRRSRRFGPRAPAWPGRPRRCPDGGGSRTRTQ